MAKFYDVEAESYVIAGLISSSGSFLKYAKKLVTSDFFHEPYQRVFEQILSLKNANDRINEQTVLDGLRLKKYEDAEQFMPDLSYYTGSTHNFQVFESHVRANAKNRQIIEALDEAMVFCKEDGNGISEKLNKISSLINPIGKKMVKKVPRSIGELVFERTTYYEQLETDKSISAWGTGFNTLNMYLSGGFRPGKVYFVAARPSVGKSSFTANLLLKQAEQGRTGLFLSQEMSCEEVVDRCVANLGNVSYTKILSGELEEKSTGVNEWSKITDVMEKVGKYPIFIDDQGGLTINDIRRKVDLIPNLNILVVDYLQLCSSENGKGGNRNSEIEEISRGLKAMSMELGIAIIVLSQLNREVEKRTGQKPMLSDLRDSGSIEQDADAVLFLSPAGDSSESDGAKLVTLSIAKNRQGRRDVDIMLNFKGEYQQWRETAEKPAFTSKPTLQNKGFNHGK
jgi:replicative DNA helicase